MRIPRAILIPLNCLTLMAFGSSALFAGEVDTNIFNPVSPPADNIRTLIFLILGITGVIFLLVEGFLLYCVIRFRQRPTDPNAEPPQIYGSKPVEIAWTVAPLITVFVIFLVVFRTVTDIRLNDETPGLTVSVVGHQWWWEYRYVNPEDPDKPIFITANELHVPVGKKVLLELRSADVIHSFWVPRLAGKTDLIPGKTNTMWFKAMEPGLYLGQCAEYCGTQHANMLLRVYADDEETYEKWIENQKKKLVVPDDQRKPCDKFMSYSCLNCHEINGLPNRRGTFGPDLSHLMSRETLAAGMIKNDEKNLTAWLKDPSTKKGVKPGCLMPDMQLADKDLKELVDFLMTLK